VDEASKQQGTILVVAQFGLIGVLAAAGLSGLLAPGSTGASRTVAITAAGMLLMVATLVGAAALAANRPGNFNVHPMPRAGGHLVTVGIYAWIRHPMYTAVLLGGLACASVATQAGALAATGALLAWVALAAVLRAKSGVEERWMAEAHPGYADYRGRTGRFVPWPR
jgi:protein-S-isoprenylcysteine O-methyltransferase Ste14